MHHVRPARRPAQARPEQDVAVDIAQPLAQARLARLELAQQRFGLEQPHLVPGRRQKLAQQIGKALHALLTTVDVVADEEDFQCAFLQQLS